MRHLFDGIASLFVIATRVRGAPFCLDPELTDSFTPGLERAIDQTTFKHEHQRALLRESFNMFARRVTSDLFVRCAQQYDGAIQSILLYFFNRGKSDDNARFHIKYTWTKKFSICFTVRHLHNRTKRKNGIHMTQKQNSLTSASPS